MKEPENRAVDGPIRAPLDAEGRFAVDVPCMGCDYNLRGLEPGGRCPECALRVTESSSGKPLRCRPVKALKSLKAGIIVAIVAASCAVLLFVVLLALIFDVDLGRASSIVPIGFPGVTILGCIGVLKSTRRDVLARKVDIGRVGRVVARSALTATAIAAVILETNLLFALFGAQSSVRFTLSALLLFLASSGALMVAFPCHLATLSSRTCRKRLGRKLKLLAGGFAFFTLSVISGFAWALTEPNSPPAYVELLLFCGLLGIGGCMALLLVALLFVRKAVVVEERLAREWRSLLLER